MNEMHEFEMVGGEVFTLLGAATSNFNVAAYQIANYLGPYSKCGSIPWHSLGRFRTEGEHLMLIATLEAMESCDD